MDSRLLDVLVCPLCKGPLVYDKAAQELICKGDRLAYPIRDGIPIMWVDQARDLNDVKQDNALHNKLDETNE